MEVKNDAGVSADFVINYRENWELNGRKDREPLEHAKYLGRRTPDIISIDRKIAPGPRDILTSAMKENRDNVGWMKAYMGGLWTSLLRKAGKNSLKSVP